MTQLEAKYFFPDMIISDIKRNEKTNYEKLKLDFSVLHANKGVYSFQIKSYDEQAIDFNSEEKEIYYKQKIVFEKFFVCNYYYGEKQKVEITINKNNNIKTIDLFLYEIFLSPDLTWEHNLKGDEYFIIKAEKLRKTEKLLNIRISLKNTPEFFENNKFYYLVTSKNKDIYQSAENTLNGVFIYSQIPICLLEPSYTISLFHVEGTEDKLIHTYNRTTSSVKNKDRFQTKFTILNDKYINLDDFSEVTEKYTLKDYLNSGVKIAVSLGIDFSNSNINQSHIYPNFHEIKNNEKNDYEKAIDLCGDIVGSFDYDQLFPVFGFGAIINSSPIKKPLMCFNLNFKQNPFIHRIDNILKAYKECIDQKKLTFSGPSYFAPLIRKVISSMDKNNDKEYHILMILTTGVIHDLQATIDFLVEASKLPFSLIIIGIGNGDFKDMEKLDGDKVCITTSKNKKRIRDIVQFVPFNKFKNKPELLSKEVLAEVPRQIAEYYYQLKNFKPQIKENPQKNQEKVFRTHTFQNNQNNINTNNNYLNEVGQKNADPFVYQNNNNNYYLNNLTPRNVNDIQNNELGYHTQRNRINYQPQHFMNINNNDEQILHHNQKNGFNNNKKRTNEPKGSYISVKNGYIINKNNINNNINTNNYNYDYNNMNNINNNNNNFNYNNLNNINNNNNNFNYNNLNNINNNNNINNAKYNNNHNNSPNTSLNGDNFDLTKMTIFETIYMENK